MGLTLKGVKGPYQMLRQGDISVYQVKASKLAKIEPKCNLDS